MIISSGIAGKITEEGKFNCADPIKSEGSNFVLCQCCKC